MTPRVPSGAAAAISALNFRAAGKPRDADWLDALAFCDRAQLTLTLAAAAGDSLPELGRERLARNLEENTERLESVRGLERQIGEWLEGAGIEFVFLKGTTQWPHFVPDLHRRVQYDVDLFCPAADAKRAWESIREKGYEPLAGNPDLPTDHFPALIRKTGWKWRGNHYDPEGPLAVDVHFRFWDEDTERLRAPGVKEFWDRRRGHALDTPDALGYAALHLLRHLLRGTMVPYHLYELAWFLEHHAGDAEFWGHWQRLHSPGLRRLEAVAFRLAREWFGCSTGETAAEEMAKLPQPVQEWFTTFAASPLEGFFRPNKDELWLHLALLDSARDKAAVLRRRLLPVQPPRPGDDSVLLPDELVTSAVRVRRRIAYAGLIARRAIYHARSIPAVLRSGFRWKIEASGLSSGYWRYLAASSLFNLGMFVFVLLYNLYLLDLGFREDFVGKTASAMTAGSVLAALPAAALARRFGLGRIIFGGFAAVGGISVLRALVSAPLPLVVLASGSGAAFSMFAVSLAPAIAGLTSEKARSTGFSISTAVSIGLGILGGWLGGHLPGWLGGKRPALLAGCALAVLSLWPAARLKIAPAPAEGAKLYPRNRFVVRFLIVFAIWNLATGTFNPFFNTYFAGYLHTPVERIGMIFSAAQLAQVAALLMAPLVLRGLGLVTGTAAMLMVTALALGGLAGGPAGTAAGGIYAVYMAFQCMCEPGINTLLMGRVREQERSGAAALMMLVAFGAQFVASFAGGGSIAKFGYPAVLATAAALAAIAAAAFRSLPGEAVRQAQPHALFPASAPDTARD